MLMFSLQRIQPESSSPSRKVNECWWFSVIRIHLAILILTILLTISKISNFCEGEESVTDVPEPSSNCQIASIASRLKALYCAQTEPEAKTTSKSNRPIRFISTSPILRFQYSLVSKCRQMMEWARLSIKVLVGSSISIGQNQHST